MPKTIEQFTEDIVGLLSGLPPNDALKVLHAAQGKILSSAASRNVPETPVLRRMIQPRGGISRIDRDQEIKDFLLSQDGPTTLEALLEKISDKFGPARTPSKSALHRWLQRAAGESAETSKTPGIGSSAPFRHRGP